MVAVNDDGDGSREAEVGGKVSVEEWAALPGPCACFVDFLWEIGPGRIDFAMKTEFRLYRIHSLIDAGDDSVGSKEVAHIYGAAVDKHIAKFRSSDESAEQSCGIFAVGPIVFVVVISGCGDPVESGITVAFVIESHSEVGIFRHPTPPAAIGLRAPHDDVVAGEVLVVEEYVHYHNVAVFFDVHNVFIFGEGMIGGVVKVFE